MAIVWPHSSLSAVSACFQKTIIYWFKIVIATSECPLSDSKGEILTFVSGMHRKVILCPNFKEGYSIVCTWPPFCWQGGGGWTSNQIFKKGGGDRTSTFRVELLGRMGWLFFRRGEWGLKLLHKKSEIFNDKKSL